MCFSATADFVAAGALAPAGVVAVRAVRRPAQLALAALPAVFALHQLVEGVVWLGVGGDVSPGLRDGAARVYLLIAQVLLPVLVPVGLALVEPDRARRRWILVLGALGALTAARLLWVVTAHRVGVEELDRTLVYDTDRQFGGVVATGYVLATCGPALVSSRRHLRWFGVASVAGLALATAIRYEAVTSVWCLYAGFASVLVVAHLRRDAREPAPLGASGGGLVQLDEVPAGVVEDGGRAPRRLGRR